MKKAVKVVNSSHNMGNKLTKDDISNWLLNDGRGIQIIGDYINDATKTKFKCSNNEHSPWLATPNNIKRGRGCPMCSSLAKKTTESMREWLLKDGRGITIESEYLGHHKKSLFKCADVTHSSWMATPCHIKNGKGCPQCAKSGFKINEAAWSYVLKFEKFIKYGITNNLQQRLWTHKHKNGNFTLLYSKYYSVGKMALEWENIIKQTYGTKHVTKGQCPDGYTETLPLHLLDSIIEIHTYCKHKNKEGHTQ